MKERNLPKEDLYIVVQWPESQYFIGQDDCYLINSDYGIDVYGSSAYLVPVSLYEEITRTNFTYIDI